LRARKRNTKEKIKTKPSSVLIVSKFTLNALSYHPGTHNTLKIAHITVPDSEFGMKRCTNG